MDSLEVHGHVPGHLDHDVGQVGLLKAGHNVVVLELTLAPGEAEDVVGHSLGGIIIGILGVLDNLSRQDTPSQTILLDHILRGCHSNNSVPVEVLI